MFPFPKLHNKKTDEQKRKEKINRIEIAQNLRMKQVQKHPVITWWNDVWTLHLFFLFFFSPSCVWLHKGQKA